MTMARYNLIIQDANGNIINGASVEVRSEATTLLAALKSDRAGTTGISNPFTATDGADVGFHVVGGSYKVRVYTGPSATPTFERIWRYVPIGLLEESDSVSTGTGTVTSITAGNQTITTSGTIITDPGYGFQNASLAVSAAGSALTIALKDAAGATPSATSPATVFFRNVAGTAGDIAPLYVTAANSLVISSGSTLGVTSATAFRLWVVGFNDGGTFRLGVMNARSGTSIYPLMGSHIASSTAEGGAGAADSAQVIYTGTAVTSKAYRVLGYIEWNTTGLTAGTWTTTNLSLVQMFGSDVALPGRVVQNARTETGSSATGTATIPVDNTIPQNTEGTQFMTQAITPVSAANLMRVKASVFIGNNNGTGIDTVAALFQDSIADALTATAGQIGSAAATGIPNHFRLEKVLAPNLSAAITFKLRAGGGTASTVTFNGINGTQTFNGVANSYMEVEEIMA